MRKYLALIVEHDDPDMVGLIRESDSPKATSEKNEATPIHKFDEVDGDFYVAGKEVSLGYIDFEDEEDYEATFGDEVKQKLREIDAQWLDQAGIELEAAEA